MRILLTGASGFVGEQLLLAIRQKQFFVRALDRIGCAQLELADEVVVETLTPHSDFKALVTDIDCLVHLADGFNGYEQLPSTAQSLEADERLATVIALAAQAARSEVRMVYLSTIKTMCGTYADEILRETSDPHPQSLYGQLKLEAERGILAATYAHGSQAVILRFPIVFGKGAGGNMAKLLRMADTPLPLPLKGLENRRSMIAIDSLIDAVMTILQSGSKEQGLFLVQDGALSATDLILSLRGGLARPARLFALPPVLWQLAGKYSGFGATLDRFARSLEIDDRKFRDTFDWHPEKPIETLLSDYARAHKTGG